MMLLYTLAEINSTNALTNSMLVAANQPFQMPNKFADLDDACLFFKNMEKKSTTVNVWIRGEYLVFEFDEEVYVSVAGVLTRNGPAIFGFLTSLRGLFMMFKSTMTSLKNDLKSIK